MGQVPTPMPPTELPTPAPTQEPPCIWETSKKQCTKAPLCTWNTAQNACVLAAAQFSTQLSSSDPFSALQPMAMMQAAIPMAATSHCEGQSKKRCAKDPECDWNASQVCVKSTATMHAATPIAATSQCEGQTKKRCTKDSECDWTASQVCVKSTEECGRRYHPRTVTERTCSNDDNYPGTWNQPSMSPTFLFASSDECCAAFYSDGTCAVDNVCPTGIEPLVAAVAPAPECDKKKWHPLTVADRICTNEENYPPLWDTSAYSAHYLLSSAEECCQEFYGGGACQIVDACEGP